MLKHRSFARLTMPRRFPRNCPVCGRPHLKNLSTHLIKVHGLSPEERKPHLKQAQVSSWQVARQPPSANAEKPREKRVSQWEHSPPAKDQEQQRVRHLWQPNPVRNSASAINSHFWLWVLHKVGKRILSNKFWKTIVSCMKSKRVFAFFGTTINGKNVTKS